MADKIQPLPQDVINLIAAGEVIDSLAAVVRELVENSIDAKANRITVSIWTDLWRVQVADNGDGMTLEDLKLCTQPHSTSKIHTSEDLWKITSLGFRGEALHSLVQLADVEILSRTSLGEGWRVSYTQQGEKVESENTAIAPGTIITISNLFGNVPVRRRGLPSRKQQLKEIQETIQNISLCYPSITWQVCKGDSPWFTISPSCDSKQLLPQFLSRVSIHDLHSLESEITQAEYSKSNLDLVIGLPDRCHRHKPDWVKVAINGRMVKCPDLEQTILAAFIKILPRDRYPICFLHITTSPGQIDWNRHPAKQVVYLHSLPFWKEQINHAIEQALRISPANLPATVHNARVGTLLKAAEEKATYNFHRTISPENTPNKNDLSLIELRAVAQVHNTYIVAEHSTGIWLVEQHIAHERVLYEQLVDHWQLEALESPLLLSQLTPPQIEQLQCLGLQIEPFGETLWAVRNAPKMLKEREDCAEALVELSWGGDLQEAQVATACRSAIRNNSPLSLPEMQTLLDQWKVTRNPRTCPHGRPIYLSLEESSLSRFFKRHWVIGKSHGI